jgi:hypothetical protein
VGVGGPAVACQLIEMLVGADVPPALVAVTEYVRDPAVVSVRVQVGPVLVHPVHE